MRWIIDHADTERGVPEAAHCNNCGTVWRRPEGDEWADTLPELGPDAPVRDESAGRRRSHLSSADLIGRVGAAAGDQRTRVTCPLLRMPSSGCEC